MLASMRKGWNGDRDIALWVKDHPEQAANWVVFRLGLGAQPSEKFPEVSNTQILNPISGKGVHAGKTELRSASSLPSQLIDSFSECCLLYTSLGGDQDHVCSCGRRAEAG